MAKKKTVKSRVPKTRNHGTMTESAFWSMIRSALRNKSRWWLPIKEAKNAVRKPVTGMRHKFEYQCAMCGGWFPEKSIAVDHIEEIGTLNKETAGEFIERLFTEVKGLQVLCNKRNDCEPSCHKKKTDAYMKGKKK